MADYYAHSGNKAGSAWEPLREHLLGVSKRAGEYADAFGAEREAIIAGLWHDLGKYSERFTQRLKRKTSGLDHWSIGAIAALCTFKEKAVAAALAIQGHHIGLQEGSSAAIREGSQLSRLSDIRTHPLGLALTESDLKELLARFEADGLALPPHPQASLYSFREKSVAAMLDVRMLFSALVDADYIETEAHFEGKPDGTKSYRPEGPRLQAGKSFTIVEKHLNELQCNAASSEDVRVMRNRLLDACLAKADAARGIFTLTAPTGAGKTLAMLAFALKHATVHRNIRRVVMVVPFLSIIEQTATIYRRLLESHFGPHYVLEHHTLSDLRGRKDPEEQQDHAGDTGQMARLLAENWDAPLVLTTSVQFFESLFANRPGKCRKLHRLTDSVILFDEVQTLPPNIAVPSLAALSRLSERYGCTVVLSTATQPAFDHLHDKVTTYASPGWRPRAIVEKPEALFSSARRVHMNWHMKESRSWDSIAEALAQEENSRSLCIVNLKRHAQQLTGRLRELTGEKGLFHLSTNMCPAHREKVLNEVRLRLETDKNVSCRLVATQCVEAGVDIDFPVVWRALGPLDAIAQAAGRCNREGKLAGFGRTIIFLPEQEYEKEYLYPPGGYKEATETTITLLNMKENEAKANGVAFEELFDIYDPRLFDQYFRLLYDLTGTTAVSRELEDAILRRSFVDVDKYYGLIQEGNINILVPYAEEMELFESLKQRLDNDGRLTRQWIRDARGLTLSLFRPKQGDIVWNYLYAVPLGHGEYSDDWFIYLNARNYDPLIGLKSPDATGAWMA